MTEKTFRGFLAIGEVVERMKPLAEHQKKYHQTEYLTLFRKDFDLLARWPKAAELHGVSQQGGVLVFMGFKLRFDKTEKRYAERA
jgi:hypothetical protein